MNAYKPTNPKHFQTKPMDSLNRSHMVGIDAAFSGRTGGETLSDMANPRANCAGIHMDKASVFADTPMNGASLMSLRKQSSNCALGEPERTRDLPIAKPLRS